MAGIVLALAGLTCGDGGQRGGAATAPAEETMRFDGWWRGTVAGKYWAGPRPRDVELGDGGMVISQGGELWNVCRATLVKAGPGKATLTLDGDLRYDCIYKLQGKDVVLALPSRAGAPRPTAFVVDEDTGLMTIRPAAGPSSTWPCGRSRMSWPTLPWPFSAFVGQSSE
jgi:hypothetical protein